MPFCLGGLFVAVLTLLVCLIPKPENDLFFELRIGTDILRTHHLPHTDPYSWTERGRHWDVPEWGAMVLYALAYRWGGFFGTWLLMAGLAVAAVEIVYAALARRIGVAGAAGFSVLLLAAMSATLQERPYAFSYVGLALALKLVAASRESRLRTLLWLLPLCVVWASLHQGVLVLVGLLALGGLGDAGAGLWERRGVPRRAWVLGAVAAACAGIVLVNPYGIGLYRSVWVTLGDRALMAGVTEWNPVSALPGRQLQPLLAVSVCVFGALAFSRQKSLGDTLAAAAMLVNALLHARNIALFAVGGLVIASPHLPSALEKLQRAVGFGGRSRLVKPLLGVFAGLILLATALVGLASLAQAIGPRGWTPEGIGEAAARVPRFPSKTVGFVQAQGFPPNLRIFNDFETGGYLLWTLPTEPVFVDGRLDVYTGRTFADMLVLSRTPASPHGRALAARYEFDCVLTENKRVSEAFLSDPGWQCVFIYPPANSGRKPHEWVLLRRKPAFAPLIARCLRAGR